MEGRGYLLRALRFVDNSGPEGTLIPGIVNVGQAAAVAR